MHTHTK